MSSDEKIDFIDTVAQRGQQISTEVLAGADGFSSGRTESYPMEGGMLEDKVPVVQIGRFDVEQVLGKGGMGIVYSAFDPKLNRMVAVKVLRYSSASQSDQVQLQARLLREAQALAKLSHENVVPVYEVGESSQGVFIIMEYVEGRSLAKWLRSSARPWQEVVRHFIAAGRGLAAGHTAGLIHRDFKPDNVLLGNDERVRVIDFGIVASAVLPVPSVALGDSDTGHGLTMQGSVLGTPMFMSPEQHTGGVIDERADQFSFCASLYWALYAQAPFEGESYEKLSQNILDGKLREPPKGHKVPVWLHAVLLRGLCTEPSGRFSDMNSLLTALSRDYKRRSRRRLLAGAAVGILGLGGIVGRVVFGAAPETSCDRSGDAIHQVWNESIANSLTQGFLATGRAHAPRTAAQIRTTLNDYASEWELHRVHTCEATFKRGQQSQGLLDLRMECYDRRLSEVSALIVIWSQQVDGKLVDHAIEAASELVPLASCEDTESLTAGEKLPEQPALRASVKRARTLMANAQALYVSGKYSESLNALLAIRGNGDIRSFAPLEASILLLEGQCHAGMGKYKAALERYKEAVRLAASAHVAPVEADAWKGITSATAKLGKFSEAMTFGETALLSIGRLGTEYKRHGALLFTLAEIARKQGQLKEAQKMYSEALLVVSDKLPDDSAVLLAGLEGMASLYRTLGKFSEAKETHLEILSRREMKLGSNHPDIGISLQNLGAIEIDLGDYSEAEIHLLRALKVFKDNLGRMSVQAGVVESSLSSLYFNWQKPEKAIAHGREAIAVFSSVYKQGHHRTAEAQLVLGEALGSRGQLEEAQLLLEASLKGQRALFGEAHEKVAGVEYALATVQLAKKNYSLALIHARAALRIWKEANGDRDPNVGVALGIVAKILVAEHKVEEASERYLQSLEILVAKVGASHPTVSITKIDYAKNLLAMKKYRLAEEQASQVLLVVKKQKNSVLTNYAKVTLAEILWDGPGDRDRAKGLMTECLRYYQSTGDVSAIVEIEEWIEKHGT